MRLTRQTVKHKKKVHSAGSADGFLLRYGFLKRIALRYRRRCDKWRGSLRFLPVAETGFVAMLGASAIIYGALEGGQSKNFGRDVERVFRSAFAHIGFLIARVDLNGLRETSEDDILSYLGVDGSTSLLFFDVSSARERLLALPWIEQANIRKIYPEQLTVTIIEREPYALWQRGQRYSVIDKAGEVIVDGSPESLMTLPRIYGFGANEHIATLMADLERFEAIRSRLSMAEYVSQRRWTLHLDNGISVHLPEQDRLAALNKLAQLDREQSLFAKDIKLVDLRLSDRISVRVNQSDELAPREASVKRSTAL